MARQTLKLINRHFKLRSCADRAFASRKRPCLQHQIKRCFGPCALPVDREMYGRQIEYARLFLLGRRDDLLTSLEKEMRAASERMEYERAAVLRDQISAVEATLAAQRIVDFRDVDQDLVGFCREGDDVQIAIMTVVSGRLLGREDRFFTGQEFPDAEILSSFLVQRYASAPRIPDEVLLPMELKDADAIAELLSDTKGKSVRVLFPRRGARLAQTELANLNAREALAARKTDSRAVDERLEHAQKKLGLPSLPRRIECLDIAHLSGSSTVGALSAVVNGAVDRGKARKYKLRGAFEGDDYGAIAEVLERRFARAKAGEPGWEPPDLLVIDGGRGQLARALAVLEELGFADQTVVAIAKEHAGIESAPCDRIFVPGRANPLPIRRETSALLLLSMARDEAHRLANSYQAKRHRRSVITSALDDIPGVGPALRKALLKQLGSISRIRAASEEELAQVPGVGEKMARRLREALARNSADRSDSSDTPDMSDSRS